MPIFGPPNVDKMKARHDIKGLISALGYTQDRSIRWRAARALEELGDERSVEQFISLLGDNDADMRTIAAEALGGLGDPRAINPLITSLKDKEWNVQNAAAKALEKLGWQPDTDERGATYWIVKREISKCIEIGAPAVSLLLDLVDFDSNSKPHWRTINTGGTIEDYLYPGDVVCALGEIGDSRAIKTLGSLLRNDWTVSRRKAAAEALGKIADKRIIEPLIIALETEESHTITDDEERACKSHHLVYDAINDALSKLGVSAVQPLIVAIKDGNEIACDALAKIQDTQAVDSLIGALKDENAQVRQAAARALEKIGDPHAVNALVVSLGDGNLDAARALKKLDWQPDQSEAGATYWISLVVLPMFGMRIEESVCFQRCAEIGTPAIKPLIAALGKEKVHEIVAQTLDQLGWQPDKSEAGAMYWIAKHNWEKCIEFGSIAVNPLITVLNEWDIFDKSQPSCREHAAELLGKIGDGRAVAPLIAQLENSSRTSELDIRIALALGEIADSHALPTLIKRLNDNQDFVNDKDKGRLNNAIVQALGLIGDIRSAEVILDRLADFPRVTVDDDIAVSAFVQMGSSVIPILSEAVGKASWNERWHSSNHRPWAAAIALGKLRDTQGVEPLIKALAFYPENEKELETLIRAIINALGEIGDKQAVDPLVAKLEKNPYEVTKALVKIGDERAVEPLVYFLRNGLDSNRRCAAEALIRIKSPKAIEPLIAVLKQPTLGWQFPSDSGAAEIRKITLDTLKAITTQDFGEDVEKWQQWHNTEREK